MVSKSQASKTCGVYYVHFMMKTSHLVGAQHWLHVGILAHLENASDVYKVGKR